MCFICGYICKQAGNKSCFNTACGFVQVSKEIVLGQSLVPLSEYNGKQSDVYISFMKVMQIYILSEIICLSILWYEIDT